ncbi:MAG: hypothetical protein Q8Q56_01460, partial [Alphaproteobacteria bacterium]|nr:hypothetical protein [Alphaproteobacteria bacterium]
MNRLKLKSAFVITLLLNSITVSSGHWGEVLVINEVKAQVQAEIVLCRANAVSVLQAHTKLTPAEATELANALVLDCSGLAFCYPLIRSSITATTTPRTPTGIVTTRVDKKYEGPLLIGIDLLFQLGYFNPARGWDLDLCDKLAKTPLRHIKPWLPYDEEMSLSQWIIEQAQSIMELLGDPDDIKIVPGKTLRGGRSIKEDMETISEIRHIFRGGSRLTPERIREFVENILTYKWFIKLGADKGKRGRFMALCFDILAEIDTDITEAD